MLAAAEPNARLRLLHVSDELADLAEVTVGSLGRRRARVLLGELHGILVDCDFLGDDLPPAYFFLLPFLFLLCELCLRPLVECNTIYFRFECGIKPRWVN